MPDLTALNYLDEKKARGIFNINNDRLYYVYLSRGSWIYRLATWRYAPEERLRLSEDFFNKALAIDPGRYEAYFKLSLVNFLRKNIHEGERLLKKAESIDKDAVENNLNEPWVQSVIGRAYKSLTTPVARGKPRSAL